MKYVALLRGINVGGNSKVEMKRLKALFEELGFSDIQTYINSGNIIFSDSKLARTKLLAAIEKGIKKEFGFEVKVLLRTAAEIQKLTKSIPAKLLNNADMRTDVLFLWDEVDSAAAIKKVLINPAVDNLKYVKGSLIWSFDRANYTKSKMPKIIGTDFYKKMTGRNVNTVRKLAELMGK
jgi:uncharacterized protein (DUF1697 family)